MPKLKYTRESQPPPYEAIWCPACSAWRSTSHPCEHGAAIKNTQDFHRGFANGREIGMATTEAKYVGVLQCCVTMLARLDLEASQTPKDFPGRAYREDLRRIIEAATGKPHPNPYTEARS